MSLAVKNEIDAASPSAGHFCLMPLGQHSFVLKTCSHVIYFDPYLTPEPARLIPPVLEADEISNAEIILGTHDHGDHIDRPSLPAMARTASRAKMIVPEAVRATVPFPSDRLLGLNDGRSIELDGVRITGIAAAHEFLDYDETTGLYPYLGYVVESDGVTVYHSGDCCNYEGLQTKLSKWHFNLMMLPINGRDARRLGNNCIGNMTYQEAVDLSGLLAPDLVVPAHFDMFAMNLANPMDFMEYMKVKFPRQKAVVPVPGKMICG